MEATGKSVQAKQLENGAYRALLVNTAAQRSVPDKALVTAA